LYQHYTEDIRAPSPAARARMIQDTGEAGGEVEGDCNRTTASPWLYPLYRVLATTPSTSRKWYQQSITLTFLRITSLKTDWARKLVCC